MTSQLEGHFPAAALHRQARRHRDMVGRPNAWTLGDHLVAAEVLEQAIEAHQALQDRFLEETTALKIRIGFLLDSMEVLRDEMVRASR